MYCEVLYNYYNFLATFLLSLSLCGEANDGLIILKSADNKEAVLNSLYVFFSSFFFFLVGGGGGLHDDGLIILQVQI